MRPLLLFPSVFRDYTDSLSEWRQQTFRSLPASFKQIIRVYEDTWSDKARDNAGRPHPGKADQVYPGIWIGSYMSATDGTMQENEINVVLNMAIECEYKASAPMTQLIRIGIEDGKLANVGIFDKAAEVIHAARSGGRSILVHCAAGVSRSSTAVLAYLMVYEGIGWSAALEIIKKSRPSANPHPLLLRSLMRDFGESFLP